jgi:hypothetical protein
MSHLSIHTHEARWDHEISVRPWGVPSVSGREESSAMVSRPRNIIWPLRLGV